MAGRDISVKKYVVRLSAGEREHLQALIRKGKSPAKRLLKARILLKADVSEAGEGWSDSWIIQALDTSASMIYRPIARQHRNAAHASITEQCRGAGVAANANFYSSSVLDLPLKASAPFAPLMNVTADMPITR